VNEDRYLTFIDQPQREAERSGFNCIWEYIVRVRTYEYKTRLAWIRGWPSGGLL